MSSEVKKNWKKGAAWILVAVVAIIVYKLLDDFTSVHEWFKNLFSVLRPFLIGLLISYILYIPCKKIENVILDSKSKFWKKHARGLSVTLTYIIFIALIVIVINFLVPILKESITDLIDHVPTYYNTVIEKYGELPEDSFWKNDTIKEKMGELQNFDIKQYINLSNDKLVDYLKGAVNVVSGIFSAFVAFIVSIYILLQRKELVGGLRKFSKAIFKEETYKNVDKYFMKGNEVFFTYISSQLLDAIVVGVILTIAMLIMKVKYAPLLGFMVGLFNLIPYFGAIVAVIIAILITFMTSGLTKAIVMGIVVIILQQIDANIINPKIVGGSLKVSPLLVIFAVTVGGAYFGIWGMLLGVPVAVVIKTIIGDWTENRVQNKKEI